MKKQIQTPTGFQTVDSFVIEEQKYFSSEELPTAEQIVIRGAYTQALVDLQGIIDISATPVIDTLSKAQVAIRQLIIALQQVASINLKMLKYLKIMRGGIDV